MADFIGGGLPTVAPSAASHSDPNASNESPAPVSSLDPPASNPGTDDPSAGIAKDAGGTSGSAYVGSPVTQEHDTNQTLVGAVIESVFGKKEKNADEFESSAATPGDTAASSNKENENTATLASTTENDKATGTGAPGVLGAVAGAAAAGTAAVASYVGLSNPETTPKEEGDKTAAEVEKSAADTETAATEKANEAAEATKQATGTSKDEGDAKAADHGVHDTSHVGSHVGNKPKQVSDHEAANRENAEAIPTAGGEKLGTAHEGESKVIPDVPPENPSADETKAGQPDQTTADNTAKNVGGATAPATGTAAGTGTGTGTTTGTPGHKHDESSPSGKPKFFDRVKAKLHLDKKDKA